VVFEHNRITLIVCLAGDLKEGTKQRLKQMYFLVSLAIQSGVSCASPMVPPYPLWDLDYSAPEGINLIEFELKH
jgi:hypothetical protein